MIEVYATYDHVNGTWDVLRNDNNECLVYGDIMEIENWLIDHKETHKEIYHD